MNAKTPTSPRNGGTFPTTRWTIVREAGRNQGRALEEFCRRYWKPVHVYVRRSGYGEDSAREMTQSFFEHLLERNLPARATPEKGRFRNFLLTSVRNHLINEKTRNRAARRDERRTFALEDRMDDGGECGFPDRVEFSPEQAFDHSWARTLIGQTCRKLLQAEASAGREELFQALQPFLIVDPKPGAYQEVSERLGRSAGSIKIAVFRLRRRFRETFREVVAETLNDRADVEEEIRHLISALGSGGV